MNNYAVGFAFDPVTLSVALVRKNRPAWQNGKLNGIGGHIEIGESPSGAMVREFHEKAGLLVPRERWNQFHHVRFPSGSHIYFYAAWVPDLMSSVKTTTDEPIELYPSSHFTFARHAEFPDATLYNLCYLIPMALTYLRTPPALRYLEG